MERHIKDSECTVDPATGCCTVCGVAHGDPCVSCGGRAFHTADCNEADRVTFERDRAFDDGDTFGVQLAEDRLAMLVYRAAKAQWSTVGTGGGCTALEMQLTPELYFLVTDGEASAPTVGQPALVSLFCRDDGESMAELEIEKFVAPPTMRELVVWLAEGIYHNVR